VVEGKGNVMGRVNLAKRIEGGERVLGGASEASERYFDTVGELARWLSSFEFLISHWGRKHCRGA